MTSRMESRPASSMHRLVKTVSQAAVRCAVRERSDQVAELLLGFSSGEAECLELYILV